MLTALYKRELGSFFFNYSAYFIFAVYMVFSLVFAVFVGMYFVVDNPAMRSYFAFQPLVLSVTLPAVTGRLWSEEAKTGTLEALLTLPADDLTLVFGKFAAAWTMGGLMILTSVPLALLTAGTVAVDPLNLASAYFGALLAAADSSAGGGLPGQRVFRLAADFLQSGAAFFSACRCVAGNALLSAVRA